MSRVTRSAIMAAPMSPVMVSAIRKTLVMQSVWLKGWGCTGSWVQAGKGELGDPATQSYCYHEN